MSKWRGRVGQGRVLGQGRVRRSRCMRGFAGVFAINEKCRDEFTHNARMNWDDRNVFNFLFEAESLEIDVRYFDSRVL